jgi:hypothetical protein
MRDSFLGKGCSSCGGSRQSTTRLCIRVSGNLVVWGRGVLCGDYLSFTLSSQCTNPSNLRSSWKFSLVLARLAYSFLAMSFRPRPLWRRGAVVLLSPMREVCHHSDSHAGCAPKDFIGYTLSSCSHTVDGFASPIQDTNWRHVGLKPGRIEMSWKIIKQPLEVYLQAEDKGASTRQSLGKFHRSETCGNATRLGMAAISTVC